MFDKVKYSLNRFGIRGLFAIIESKIFKKQTLIQVSRADVTFPLYLRYPSSDMFVFEQVFISQDYKFNVARAPAVIIDAGANIGLASVYFANVFPGARIVAIEPDQSNFQLLQRNTSKYKNITTLNVALWHENKPICLVDPGLGEWGYTTQEQNDRQESCQEIRAKINGMTVDEIMAQEKIDHIDIFKVDIEGAELEVFRNASSWIENVDALIAELHERYKPGCDASFYAATRGYENEWMQGEYVYRTRKNSCLVVPIH